MYKMEASLVFYLNIYLVIIYDEGLSCDEAMKQASFSPEYIFQRVVGHFVSTRSFIYHSNENCALTFILNRTNDG